MNSKTIQTPRNLYPHQCSGHGSVQIYFLTTSKGMDQTILNLDLKNFSNKVLFCTLIGGIISNSKHTHIPQNLCSRKHPSWIQVYCLTTSKEMDKTISNSNDLQTPQNSCPVNTLAAYKFTFCQLPREWTRPSETSI